jgi:predicted methyltransferase
MKYRVLVGITCFVASACAESARVPTAAPTPAPPVSSAPAAPAAAAPSVASAPPPSAESIVAAPDRSEQDRALDAGRKPAELLAFIGAKPGMRVAELGAGGGYTAELLARAVAPNGAVYGQNTKFLLERFAEKPWSERLAKPVMKNVVRVDRDFDDPLPPEAKNLDAVVMVLFYHDTVWQGVDRGRMNRAIFAALRPGGEYVIVDHSGRPGTGAKETESLHRIEESVVRSEIESAGFRFARSADFLKNPGDTRDWSASPRVVGERRGTSDRFVLAFVKP